MPGVYVRAVQDNVAIGILGVTSGVVNLWLPVSEVFSEPSKSLQVGAHLACLQAVVRLSSLMMRAWPGPGLARGWQDRTTAAAAHHVSCCKALQSLLHRPLSIHGSSGHRG